MSGPVYQRIVVARKPKYKYRFVSKKTKRSVGDNTLIEKLLAIKVPPTYTRVELYPDPKNHLQATAYDGTGRKQYFYSEEHRQNATRAKYCNLIHLGKALPKILKDIDSLLRKRDINQDVLDAIALKVMIICNFRVGNDSNQKKYETYGLTTLLTKHLTFHNGGKDVTIKFVGKKKQINQCMICDKKIVAFLRKISLYHRGDRCKCRDAQHTLFKYKTFRVTGESLNDFLNMYHPEITTKTWRTWFANEEFIDKINVNKIDDTKTARRRLANQIIKENAEELHHTAAIHKKNYLTKELPELYINHSDLWTGMSKKHRSSYNFLMSFLKGYCALNDEKGMSTPRKQSRKRSK